MTGSVGVVVCCYTERRWDPLLAALRSVQRQTRVPDRVVVVVDHNAPLLERLAAVTAGSGVLVLPSAGSPGLSGARNTGVAACGTDVVAFLDDDAEAEADWLRALAAEYADPAVTAVGGRIEARWEQGRPDWFPEEFGWVVGCSYRGQPAGRAVVRNVIGANMSVRARAVDEVGGFAESLGRSGAGAPMGGEETELCIRLAAAGGTVLQQPAAVVHHLVPGSRGTIGYFRSRCWAEGRSKAGVSLLAGTSAALSAERDYATRVLPRGFLREVRRALRSGDRAAAGRGAAILGGLLVTAAGYATGRASDVLGPTASRWRGRSSVPGRGTRRAPTVLPTVLQSTGGAPIR